MTKKGKDDEQGGQPADQGARNKRARGLRERIAEIGAGRPRPPGSPRMFTDEEAAKEALKERDKRDG